ncbi:MAG: GAF domain-containing sensor histidine kinase [Actinobacteria bacterium]|jgi:signal transduction histidine kinase|nr:GAF domain-containing sensor histidine kinase [Actinomycetota bacterium]
MSAVTSDPSTRWVYEPPEPILVVVRVGVLVLCGVSAFLDLQPEGAASFPSTQLALLAMVALLASVPLPWAAARRWRPLAEAAAAACIIGLGPTLAVSLMPYLVVPPLAAGLLLGIVSALGAAFVQFAGIVGLRAASGGLTGTSTRDIITWTGLGLATGLVGAWVRRVTVRQREATATYVTAHQLLTRLRDVARALPTGLDEVALAQQVLGDIAKVVEFDRAALYGSAGSGVLMPLAYIGADHIEWDPDIDEGIWSKVWATGRPVQQSGTFTDPATGHSAVLALRLGDRRVGLVGFEREGGPWGRREVARAQELVDSAALRIDTGQLFSEVRALATVEERRRLAREIHDGVAQEVAALGFAVDDLRARSTDPEVRDDLESLRGELTRIVSELRLSIFDLRSDVQPAAGLGAALTSYVRSVGTGSSLTVHLVLDESPYRLPIEAETELLRVAQEAITNARRHAHANNLWVTCRVDPPRAFLRVADDGRGLGTARADSFGMEIMRERSARLGASLTVRQRVGGGTVVEVTLGAGTARRPAAQNPLPARGDA